MKCVNPDQWKDISKDKGMAWGTFLSFTAQGSFFIIVKGAKHGYFSPLRAKPAAENSALFPIGLWVSPVKIQDVVFCCYSHFWVLLPLGPFPAPYLSLLFFLLLVLLPCLIWLLSLAGFLFCFEARFCPSEGNGCWGLAEIFRV